MTNHRWYTPEDIACLRQAKRMRDAGLGLRDMALVFDVLTGSRLGVEVDAVSQVRAILARARIQLDIADELANAVNNRLLRTSRSSDTARRPTLGPGATADRRGDAAAGAIGDAGERSDVFAVRHRK